MLKNSIKSLPNSPGIYQFFDKDDKLLYVGKAKNLKNRVKSYFRFTPSLAPSSLLSLRIKNMIAQAVSLNYIKVQSEHDAFILENSLIKQLKPKYNILLRDDKTYPYIMIDLSEDFPRFEITRKVRKGANIKYFGPYSSGAKELLAGIYQSFPLVQKKSCAKGKKACLFHQIGRCLAPCEGKITKQNYSFLVKNALSLIYNQTPLLKKLDEKMQYYSGNLNFEEAANVRDMIAKIKKCNPQNNIDLARMEDFDLLAIYEEQKSACVMRLFIRQGKVVSNSHLLTYSNNGFDIESLFKQSLLSFYKQDTPMPINTLYLSHDIEDIKELEELLGKRFDKKIYIKCPKKGDKLSLVKLALNNAKEMIKRQNCNKYFNILDELSSFFDFAQTIRNIEVFDNSHLSTTASVGAMISWQNDTFNKSQYRQFHLQSKDEYSQMRELLSKRVHRFDKLEPPDLWLIDGGKVLLDLALDIVASLGVNIEVLAISKEKIDFKANRAKGRARDVIHDKNRSYYLNTSDVKLQFLQKLRDEAHRFAISFHRKTKLKEDKSSSHLQKIGLSEAKIKKLLLYFGTFQAIKEANLDEIASVIGKNEAKKLF